MRMRVIKRDEGRPVLAGLGRLGLRIHFDCILRNIVMLHNIDCFTPIRIAENLVDVGRIKEIAVTENGPAVMRSQIRREETRQREFGRGIVCRPIVKSEFSQSLLL